MESGFCVSASCPAEPGTLELKRRRVSLDLVLAFQAPLEARNRDQRTLPWPTLIYFRLARLPEADAVSHPLGITQCCIKPESR